MKKFLFTLVALMMTGSLCAEEYMFINDFEVTQEQLGTTIANVEVYAHFDAMVNAFTVDLGQYNADGEFLANQLPGGLTITKVTTSMASNRITYLTEEGEEEECRPSIGKAQENTRYIGITSAMDVEYDYIDGVLTDCGAIKWKPGEFVMLKIDIAIPADFEGCDLVIRTQPSCSQTDPRGNVAQNGQSYFRVCHITVEGGVEPPMEQTEKPVITVVDDPEAQTVTVTATGNGHICLYWDDMLQAEGEGEAVWVIPYGDEAEEYGVSATAQEEGKEVSEYALATVEVPQKTVVVEQTEKPVITYVDDPEAQTVTVTATGNGHICLYWDDMLQAEGEGVAAWVIPYGDDPEGEEYGISATAQEEGKEVSEYALATIFVPGKEVVPPTVTPTPEIVITPDADNMGYTIEVVGEGELHLYINGEEVENPYHIDRTDEAQVLVITATAQIEDLEVSVPAEKTFTVPAFTGEGIYIVLIDQDGNEYQYDLYPSANNPNNYVTMVTLEYNPWGAFDPYYEERPVVPFYFIVNGERLGAEADMTPTAMGPIDQTLQNPLFANENCYTVPVGYTYTIGIQFTADGDMYVLCAQGGMVGVDELNADKTVAGVRYFNMAGQEMQEVNGATIVVTTYTDGTTSAVKVIK